MLCFLCISTCLTEEFGSIGCNKNLHFCSFYYLSNAVLLVTCLLLLVQCMCFCCTPCLPFTPVFYFHPQSSLTKFAESLQEMINYHTVRYDCLMKSVLKLVRWIV